MARKTLAEISEKAWIFFYGKNLSSLGNEQFRQGAKAGTDLQDNVCVAHPGGIDMRPANVSIDEEALSQSFARPDVQGP